MYRFLKLSAFILFVGVFSGCASVNKMPLSEKVKSVDTSEKSILVGRLKIQNQNKPKHQPDLLAIFVSKDGKDYSFTKPTLVKDVENKSKDYIFSMNAEPGQAELSLARFLRKAFLIVGNAELPFKQQIEFPKSGIVYVGNIVATIVPREEGQPRAGSIIPLIDQAATGFSSGTFVVDITDNYEEDMKVIRSKFPYLKDTEITKAILPKWEYPAEDKSE